MNETSLQTATPFEISTGEIVLPNRARLRLRRLLEHEDDVVRDLYASLSPRSRYLRFFSVTPVLPDSVVGLLLGTDDPRQVSVVAEFNDLGDWSAVGLATLAPIDECTAEVGLVVRDDWQGQGVGTALATDVLDAAERLGLRRFIAHMLAGNKAARRLLAKVGAIVSAKVRGDVSEYVFVRKSGGSDRGTAVG